MYVFTLDTEKLFFAFIKFSRVG